MEEEAFFTIVAEISIGFAGFSGLIGLFGRRERLARRLSDTPEFWIMIEGALGTLFFALLPLILTQLERDESALWRLGSALMALSVSAFQIHGLALHRRAGGGRLPRPIAVIAVFTVPAAIVGVGILVANTAGAFGAGLAWPYSAVLFGSLVAVGLNFVLLLRCLSSDL